MRKHSGFSCFMRKNFQNRMFFPHIGKNIA